MSLVKYYEGKAFKLNYLIPYLAIILPLCHNMSIYNSSNPFWWYNVIHKVHFYVLWKYIIFLTYWNMIVHMRWRAQNLLHPKSSFQNQICFPPFNLPFLKEKM
jgi:hypothetical protein